MMSVIPTGDFYKVGGGQLTEVVVNVDRRGRILIPAAIRKKLNIRNAVKIIVEEDKLILRPMEDPLKQVEELVIKGTSDVEQEIRRLRKAAEERLLKED